MTGSAGLKPDSGSAPLGVHPPTPATRRWLWAKKGGLAVSDQVFVSGCNFLLTVLLARTLAPESYGAYVLAFSIFLLVADLHHAFLLEPLSVLGPSTYNRRKREYLGALLWLHAALGFLVAAVLGAAAIVAGGLGGSEMSGALAGAAIASPCVLLFWLARSACYVELAPGWATTGAAVYACLVLGGVWAFRSWLGPFTVFLLTAIAAGAVGTLMLARFRPALRPAARTLRVREVWREHWGYGRWALAAGGVDWVVNNFSFVLTGAFLGLRDVGALKAVGNLLLPVNHVAAALQRLVQPYLAGLAGKSGGRATRAPVQNVAMLVSGGAVGVCILLSIFGTPLLGFLYGPKFNDYAYLIPWMAIAVVGAVGAQVFGAGLRAMQSPVSVFKAHGISGAIFAVAGAPAVWAFGLAGIVGVTAAASVAGLVAAAVLYYRKLARGEEAGSGRNGARRNLRVAWTMPSLARGFYWQPVFKEFTRMVPENVVFTGIWPGFLPDCEGAFRVERCSGGRVVSVKGVKFIWASPVLLWRLLRFRPDVIFTGGFHLSTAYGLATKLLTRCRMVLLWDGISSEVAQLESPRRLRLRRAIARRFDLSISNTKEGVEYLEQAIGIPPARLRHHPYQVPDPRVLGSAGGGAGIPVTLDRPVFLYVGQLLRAKGIHKLLEACALLSKRGSSFSCVLVGDGDDAADLRRLAVSLGVERHLHWAGLVQYSDLGAYYRTGDVFVFPTLHDVWGMVVLEAMLFGKPVLCSRYAGSREMVRGRENGLLFDPLDPEELANRMAEFIANPGLIPRYGARSRQLIAPYTPERAAHMLAAAVSEV